MIKQSQKRISLIYASIGNNKLLILTILLTLIGGFLRFYNLNWDSGYTFHPDERNIANAVSQIRFFSQLNPNFFAYGGFLIYLYKTTGDILSILTQNTAWVHDWGHINLIGRFYSALFSTLTIPLVFVLARNIFNKYTGVVASLFTAFNVSFIQTSHFSITENFLILLSVLICFLSFTILKTRRFKYYILCGAFFGVAVATKTVALSFIIFPLISHALIIAKHPYKFKKRVGKLIAFLLVSFAIFSLFSPYTFIKWSKFMESMRYESGVALGTLPVPYTLQFTNTIPYLFQIKNFVWQMGPISYLLIPSVILLILIFLKTKNFKLILIISFPLIYFLYVGHWHTKFIRFMLPTIPFIIIFISYLLYVIHKKIKYLGRILIIASIISTIFWALAFFSIYTREQTRITSSRWIYNHIPLGSKILGEHWDDGLPVSINSSTPSIYDIEQLTIYDQDNQAKIDYYAQKLSTADYIVINSRRLYGTLINLHDKYPITSKYYKLLFNGKLGYKKVAEFSSYPSFLGIEINDDSSEETFQVYDHPKVIIFENTKSLKNKDIKDLINNDNL
ncbi:MAG: glycosyltransferase family 39 protein [Candidatus Levybacteria bacterium]|nr:glycosyltransferase family 39 protein [Candidatus Levybacteria bacterium]